MRPRPQARSVPRGRGPESPARGNSPALCPRKFSAWLHGVFPDSTVACCASDGCDRPRGLAHALRDAPTMPQTRGALTRLVRERGALLVVCMLLAIGGVMALAWWDSLRESDAVFHDVGDEQSVLASVVAVDLNAHLRAVELAVLASGERSERSSD